MVKLRIILLGVLATVGCMARPKESVNQALLKNMKLAEQQKQETRVGVEKPGALPSDPAYASLWVGESNHRYVFRDGKAQHVGDLVTVIIVEESKASSSGRTETKKDSDFSASLSPFGATKPAGENIGWGNILDSETKNNFKGEGKTDRTGMLNARITAVIEAVLPNGNFFVRGSKVVQINNEDQMVSITGFVRPDDIRIDNTVLSSFIADAEIAYSGNGVVGDKQRVGWLARLLDWVWPF